MKVKGLVYKLKPSMRMSSTELVTTVSLGELQFAQRLTSTGIPMVQNRQSYNLKNPTENYTQFPGQNVTLVLYHPSMNADLTFLRKRQTKKLLNLYWPVICAECRKSLAFIQQRGSDFSQAQCSKHASTGLPLSSNTKPFRAVPMTFLLHYERLCSVGICECRFVDVK